MFIIVLSLIILKLGSDIIYGSNKEKEACTDGS